jgi:DNA-directed RNA polymerase subunit N (RpoN/RPB10)
MLCLPKCPECGFDIGACYGLFRAAREELMRSRVTERVCDKSLSTAARASMLAVADYTEANVDMSEVFDALGVTRYCCRAHLASARLMVDVVLPFDTFEVK